MTSTDSLTEAIRKLADTDYVTAAELAAANRRLDLGILADRLEQLASEQA